MDRTIIRAIDSVLESWAKLDDKHKGQDYEKAVENLKTWKSELIAKTQLN